MPGGYKNINSNDGNTFSSTNQPGNQGRKKKIYTVVKEMGFGSDDFTTLFNELFWYDIDSLEIAEKDKTKPIIYNIAAGQLKIAKEKHDFWKIKDIFDHIINNKKEPKAENNNALTTKASEATRIYLENYHSCSPKYSITINRGGTSSTKTYSLIQISLDFLLTGKIGDKTGKSFDIVRSTLPLLRSNTIKYLEDLISEKGLTDKITQHKTDKYFKCEDRTLAYYSVYDNKGAKRLDKRRDFLYINEAPEIGCETFKQLISRTKKHTFIDLNPDDETTWVNQDIEIKRAQEQGDVKVIVSTYKDNPFLDDAIIREIEYLMKVDPEYAAIFGFGQYSSISGLVYPIWHEYNTIPDGEYLKQFGVDFGFSPHPTAIIEQNINRKVREVYEYEHCYDTEMNTTDIVTKLKYINPNNFDVICDSAEKRLIDELIDAGINAFGAIKGPNSILPGIRVSKKYKRFVHTTSMNHKTELKRYKRPKDPRTGKYLKDPLKIWDDSLDASRYGLVYYDSMYGYQYK